ncbi:MAG: gyrase subunit, partial [Actinomycetota bacterium]
VGMATNLPPHNLGEVVAACRYLLKNPKATVAELMKYLPGPDLPTGGVILGLDGIRDAYVEGRGSFKMRATVSVENVTARRQALVVTELPYNVGPEKLIEKIKDSVTAKKITGISDIIDLSDGDRGLRIVIELKSGFNPQAVLQQLYKLTPLEDQFSINAVALVDGAPQTLGLVDLLAVFLKHRISVVRRRTEFRRKKAQERLHLVAGLLIAIIDIDEVIQVIRSSDDTAAARERLMKAFDLSEIQTNYILEMPLRRLTKFSRIELEKESEQLHAEIAELTRILEEPKAIEALVSDELADVAKEFATPRRTVLQESDGTSMVSADLEIADDPCVVMLSSSGLLARFPEGTVANLGGRTKHDVVVSKTPATARGEIGLVTSFGRIHKLSVVEIASLAANETALSLKGGSALKEFVILDKKEVPLALVPLTEEAVLALGTLRGVIKRVTLDIPKGDVFDVIRLEDGDSVVGAGVTTNEDQHLVFVTTDGQLLHFEASLVRPQGRGAGGMAGINLSKGASVLAFMVAAPTEDVLTVAGSTTALPGTDPGTFKVTPLSEYPTKGRATGGVRCHTLRKSENALLFAAVVQAPLRAAAAGGANVDLSFEYSKRDATGTALSSNIVAVAGRMGA